MLSNVRRKMIQKSIKKYSEFKINEWWDVKVGLGIFKYLHSGNQRYSKKKIDKPFENTRLVQGKIPYYKVDDEIYNMILCPSGIFIKGSNRGYDSNPKEKMKIEKSFLLGETEVTQELYESVMGKNPSICKNKPKNPVELISWYDAVMFCNKLSDIFGLDQYYAIGNAQKIKNAVGNEETHYPIEMNEDSKGFRLPTEWEWEYAAKAGTQLRFSGSNDPNEVAWYGNNSNRTTHPIKQKKPNAWGFYDMSGNVSEWCENKYHPKNMKISAERVYRGGNWVNEISDLNSTSTNLDLTTRLFQSPSGYCNNVGFRICRYI